MVFFGTREAAKLLADQGFPVQAATLRTWRTRGGGPPARRFGSRVLYEPDDLLRWAHARLSAPRTCTAEADAEQVSPQTHVRPGPREVVSHPIPPS